MASKPAEKPNFKLGFDLKKPACYGSNGEPFCTRVRSSCSDGLRRTLRCCTVTEYGVRVCSVAAAAAFTALHCGGALRRASLHCSDSCRFATYAVAATPACTQVRGACITPCRVRVLHRGDACVVTPGCGLRLRDAIRCCITWRGVILHADACVCDVKHLGRGCCYCAWLGVRCLRSNARCAWVTIHAAARL